MNTKKLLSSTETGKGRLSSSCPFNSAGLYFRLYLFLLKVNDSKRYCRELTIFPAFLKDGSYVRDSLEAWVELKAKYMLKARNFPEGTAILRDGSFSPSEILEVRSASAICLSRVLEVHPYIVV